MHTTMFFIGGIRRSHTPAPPHRIDDTPTLLNDQVVLKVFTQGDVDAFFRLYSAEGQASHQQPNLPHIRPNDTPESFALRIVAACELVWTIRTNHNPAVIVGECTLHNWKKESGTIEFCGTLFPQFRGQGIMQSVFRLVATYATTQYEAASMVSHTSTKNDKAIRFAERMGFKKATVSNDAIRWQKFIY